MRNFAVQQYMRVVEKLMSLVRLPGIVLSHPYDKENIYTQIHYCATVEHGNLHVNAFVGVKDNYRQSLPQQENKPTAQEEFDKTGKYWFIVEKRINLYPSQHSPEWTVIDEFNNDPYASPYPARFELMDTYFKLIIPIHVVENLPTSQLETVTVGQTSTQATPQKVVQARIWSGGRDSAKPDSRAVALMGGPLSSEFSKRAPGGGHAPIPGGVEVSSDGSTFTGKYTASGASTSSAGFGATIFYQGAGGGEGGSPRVSFDMSAEQFQNIRLGVNGPDPQLQDPSKMIKGSLVLEEDGSKSTTGLTMNDGHHDKPPIGLTPTGLDES